MKYKHYILPLALAALASCSSDNDMQQPTPDGLLQLRLTSSLEGMTTRAANNLQTTSLASGNNVGVMVHEATPEGMQIASNTCYTVGTNGELTLSATSAPICLQSDNDVNIHSYAPFRADMLDGYLNTSTKTDQSTSDNYIASDFLFGSPKAGNPVHPLPDTPVELSYRHIGSRIVVKLVPGTGIDASYLQGAQLTTCPLSTDVSFYPKTQQMTVSSSTSSNITIGKVTSPTDLTHAAVILPQTVPALTNFLTVSFPDDANKLSFIYSPTADLTFESGKQYLYTMTVGKNGVNTTTEVKPWDENTAHTGGWELDDKSSPKQDVDLSQQTPNENDEILLSYNATVSGTTSSKVIVEDGCDVTLKDATINNALVCQGNTTINIEGNNKITVDPNTENAGIQAGKEGTTLRIELASDAKLEVHGGSCSAGIGSKNLSSCGDIIINGGKIIAYGNDNSPGIGAGYYYSKCGNITINNAKVSAYGVKGSAGIGTGSYDSQCKKITINNSIVYSEGRTSIGLSSSGSSANCESIYVENSTCTLKTTNTTNNTYFSPKPTFSGTVKIYDSSDTTNDITTTIDHNTVE